MILGPVGERIEETEEYLPINYSGEERAVRVYVYMFLYVFVSVCMHGGIVRWCGHLVWICACVCTSLRVFQNKRRVRVSTWVCVCVCTEATLHVGVSQRLFDEVACYPLWKCWCAHRHTLPRSLLHFSFSLCQPLFLSLTAVWTCLFLPLYLPLCISHWCGECVKIQVIVQHWMRLSLHGTVPLGMHLSQTMSLSLLPLYHRKCVSDRKCVPIYSICFIDEC